jgi:uncharacterized protein HemY
MAIALLNLFKEIGIEIGIAIIIIVGFFIFWLIMLWIFLKLCGLGDRIQEWQDKRLSLKMIQGK